MICMITSIQSPGLVKMRSKHHRKRHQGHQAHGRVGKHEDAVRTTKELPVRTRRREHLEDLQALGAGLRGGALGLEQAVQQQFGLPGDVALLAARSEQQARRALHQACATHQAQGMWSDPSQ